MTVSILGCGWFGKALAKALIGKGIKVKGSATAPEKLATLAALGINPYLISIKTGGEIVDNEFFKCDVLLISIPPKARHGEGADYLPKINTIINYIITNNIDKVVYISSTGVYGDNNSEVDELSDPNPDSESGKILLEAEKLFRAQSEFKTTVIRFGGLVGPGRDPARFFAGKTDIPNGKAPVNLIHLDDCVGITKTIIDKDAFGHLINGVCPHHPQKAGFYRAAALQSGLTTPEFIDELKKWKIVNSRQSAAQIHYQFSISNWDNCGFL